MRRNIVWITPLLAQIGIGLTLLLDYTSIHSTSKIFWAVYLIITTIIGIIIPILSYFVTNRWYYGIISSAITGFFVFVTFSMVAFSLRGSRGAIFLPVGFGFIETIYIVGNLVGTLLVYILSYRKLKS